MFNLFTRTLYKFKNTHNTVVFTTFEILKNTEIKSAGCCTEKLDFKNKNIHKF